jgi:hypothetical protein
MSRIDQAWRRADRQITGHPETDAFPFESFPAEAPAPAAALSAPSAVEPRTIGPHVVHRRPRHASAAAVVPFDTVSGVAAQCARLVDALRARPSDGLLDIVVLTTPVVNAHVAHAAIHVARLLAADGTAVVLIDANAQEPRVATLLGVEAAAAGGEVDVCVADVPPLQLAILNGELHELAARMRAVAEQSGARWVVVHAPALSEEGDRTPLRALARAGDAAILVVPASTPTPAIGAAVAAVGRQRLVGTVLVGVAGL